MHKKPLEHTSFESCVYEKSDDAFLGFIPIKILIICITEKSLNVASPKYFRFFSENCCGDFETCDADLINCKRNIKQCYTNSTIHDNCMKSCDLCPRKTFANYQISIILSKLC